MTTRIWRGGEARFDDPQAWSPAGWPATGDSLAIISGTAVVHRAVLSGLSIQLGAEEGVPPAPGAATLRLGCVVIAQDTQIRIGGVTGLASPSGPENATIMGCGVNLNGGTITAAGFGGWSHVGKPGLLTIEVGSGGREHACAAVFVNAGTLRSVANVSGMGGTIVVQAQSGHAVLYNAGLIEAGTFVKLDIDVLGAGRMVFGAPYDASYIGPILGARIETTGDVGHGQTVDFRTATGVDSHGTLILDDPRDFHARIADFVPGAGNFSPVHADRIELPGVTISALHYDGDTRGGVLTVDAGGLAVAHLRFAGSYTTDRFQTVPLFGGTGIELKSA